MKRPAAHLTALHDPCCPGLLDVEAWDCREGRGRGCAAGAVGGLHQPELRLIFFICPVLKLPSGALERSRRQCLCAGAYQRNGAETPASSRECRIHSVSSGKAEQWREQGPGHRAPRVPVEEAPQPLGFSPSLSPVPPRQQ